MPAACISGETANQGCPPPAYLGVDLVDAGVVGADHRRHVHVALPPQHALGTAGRPAGAHHDQVVGRPRRRVARTTLCQRIIQRYRARQVGGVASVVDRDQQLGTVRRQHLGAPRTDRAVVDDAARPDVGEQLGDLPRRVAVVHVDRHGSRLEAPDHRVRVQVVVHDERDPVLTTLPAVQCVPLSVRTEAVGVQKVCQLGGSPCRFGEGAPALSAYRHRPVGDDVGDGVQHRPDGPFAHGPGCLGRHGGFDAQKI